MREATGHIQKQTQKITADFSVGTLKARRAWNDVFHILEGNN
jgi:hypothetical protein